MVATFRTSAGSLHYLTKAAKQLRLDRSELIRRLLEIGIQNMPELKEIK